MESQVALITGGIGGIGTAICKELFRQKVKVIATYFAPHEEEKSAQWQNTMKADGYQIDLTGVDVSDYESCKKMAADVLEKFGQVDILVNNAGITRDASFRKMTVEQWNEVIGTDLDSIFNVTHAFVKKMVENKYGRIINISSITAQKGQFGQTNYAAAKAGIHGFTKTLALELASKNITVNTISPGFIQTEMTAVIPEEVRAQVIKETPIGRLGQPEEIAWAVTFLAAKRSQFITGVNLAVNGGLYML